jgi:ferredoxin
MAGSVKVTIDREECISCGACYDNCPEFFEENQDDAYSQVVAEYRVGGNPGEGAAPAELEDCVRSGADACPVEIIHVE